MKITITGTPSEGKSILARIIGEELSTHGFKVKITNECQTEAVWKYPISVFVRSMLKKSIVKIEIETIQCVK